MTTVAISTERSLEKAKLIEIDWNDDGTVKVNSKNQTTVQFNPASLKVSYSNQVQTNDQSTGAAMQYVGRGISTLSTELIFDVSGAEAANTQDVRRITEAIAQFMRVDKEASPADVKGKKTRYKVSGVRFQWGTFLFDGILESVNETLDLWSEDGHPLRSTVGITLKQPGIHFKFHNKQNSSSLRTGIQAPPAGTTQPVQSPKGGSVQDLVAKAGLKTDWKAIAAQNGIENPRHIAAGTLIDLENTASASLNAKVTSSLGSSLPALEFAPFEEAKVAAQLNARELVR